ncbi:hypothetical protein ScPMuIL_007122 [Solemya velum]
MSVYDAIVVGAGVEGSSAAYHLSKNGKRTLLLEQFPLPHSRGSSHGQSRITRKSYGKDEFYTDMMMEAFPLWEQLEKESGTSLYRQTSLLLVSGPSDRNVEETQHALQTRNIPHQIIPSGRELKEKFPNLEYPDNYRFLLDYSGGLLYADRAVKAFQNEFKRNGGILKDGEPMLNIYPGDIITVRTTEGEYRTHNLVLCPGPWAPKVLEKIGLNPPLKPIKVIACYWKEKTPGEHGSSRFPTIIHCGGDIYALPAYEYPGLFKLALHSGPESNPDHRDAVDDGWILEKVQKYVATHLPSLEPVPSVKENCMYTLTPDSNPIIDTHPKWKNIAFGVGFSGDGFKLAPVVGKLLCELVTGRTPSYSLEPFRLGRFSKSRL